jgi:ribonuclease-3
MTGMPTAPYQDLSQRIDGATPQYKVLEEVGPDHDKIFTLGVYVGRTLMGKGSGHSKQVAQQDAAKAALKRYEKQQSVTD